MVKFTWVMVMSHFCLCVLCFLPKHKLKLKVKFKWRSLTHRDNNILTSKAREIWDSPREFAIAICVVEAMGGILREICVFLGFCSY